MSDVIFYDSIRIGDVVQMLNEGRVVLAHPHYIFALTTPKVYIWKIDNGTVRVVKDNSRTVLNFGAGIDEDRCELWETDTLLGINKINCGRYITIEPVPKKDVPGLMRRFKENIKDF